MCFVNAKRVELGPHPALVVVCEQALFCDVGGEGKFATRVGGSADKIFFLNSPKWACLQVTLAEKWCDSFFCNNLKTKKSQKCFDTYLRAPYLKRDWSESELVRNLVVENKQITCRL